MRRSDGRHRQIANDGIYISGESVAPLLAMLWIAPAFLVGGYIGCCGIPERGPGYLCRLGGRSGVNGVPAPLLQRINSRFHLEAQRRSFVARIGKRHSG